MDPDRGYPDALASDPLHLGWMQGSPPPPDKTIRHEDGSFLRFPQTRWSYSHMRQFGPTVAVPRGSAPVAVLPRDERGDLDTLPIVLGDARLVNWLESLALNYTDGIVVLHRGTIVYERYFGAGAQHRPHIAFSVTKSFVGTLAALLAHEQLLDTRAPVTHYVPELARSAYGDATVRQVMDMTVGVDCSEDYQDPKAGIWELLRAAGILPPVPGGAGPRTLCDYLVGVPKRGAHGEAFAYHTVNTEVLGWILRRVSGRPFAQLLSERIWQKLGAEHDAYMLIDRAGTELCGSGLAATLRDLARFGEALRLWGYFNGQQILPAAVVEDIRRGADAAHFARARIYSTSLPGASYRNMWWVTHNAHGAFSARGVHGQTIWIDPAAEMVVARFASHHLAANVDIDPTSLPCYEALARHLVRQGGT